MEKTSAEFDEKGLSDVMLEKLTVHFGLLSKKMKLLGNFYALRKFIIILGDEKE